MCTLSVLRSKDGLVVTMNRDERRDRPEALELEHGVNGNGVSYVYPVDARTGGSWFGVRADGGIFALLNRYDAAQPRQTRSRGAIIPRSLRMSKLEEVGAYVLGRDWNDTPPFDLMMMNIRQAHSFCWNGSALGYLSFTVNTPFFRTSSSERAHNIIPYRKRIFEAFVRSQNNGSVCHKDILQRLHLERDESDRERSILMDRPSSHTKSISQAVLTEKSLTYSYYPRSDGRAPSVYVFGSDDGYQPSKQQ